MFGETEQKTEILNQGVFITKIGLSVFRYYIKSIIHSFKIINSIRALHVLQDDIVTLVICNFIIVIILRPRRFSISSHDDESLFKAGLKLAEN